MRYCIHKITKNKYLTFINRKTSPSGFTDSLNQSDYRDAVSPLKSR